MISLFRIFSLTGTDFRGQLSCFGVKFTVKVKFKVSKNKFITIIVFSEPGCLSVYTITATRPVIIRAECKIKMISFLVLFHICFFFLFHFLLVHISYFEGVQRSVTIKPSAVHGAWCHLVVTPATFTATRLLCRPTVALHYSWDLWLVNGRWCWGAIIDFQPIFFLRRSPCAP